MKQRFKINQNFIAACGYDTKQDIFEVIKVTRMPSEYAGLAETVKVTVDRQGIPWVVDSCRGEFLNEESAKAFFDPDAIAEIADKVMNPPARPITVERRYKPHKPDGVPCEGYYQYRASRAGVPLTEWMDIYDYWQFKSSVLVENWPNSY